jgi:hypothetical protein
MSQPTSAGESAPTSEEDDQLVSPAVACRLLSCSLPTLKRIDALQPILLRDGGRSVRYKLSDIRRYLASRGAQPVPPTSVRD